MSIHREWRGEGAGGEGRVETQRPPHREAGDTRDETSLSLLRERQNVAIRGGGVRERRRACFMFNCVIMRGVWRIFGAGHGHVCAGQVVRSDRASQA